MGNIACCSKPRPKDIPNKDENIPNKDENIPNKDVKYSLRLGSIIPNFEYKSTHDSGKFHDFLKNSKKCDWTLLFSHPKDYTPVCTTELAECHKLSAEFESMGVKLCGISCDNLEDHCGWTKDVLNWAGDDKSKQ